MNLSVAIFLMLAFTVVSINPVKAGNQDPDLNQYSSDDSGEEFVSDIDCLDECCPECLTRPLNLSVHVIEVSGSLATFCIQVKGRGWDYGGGRIGMHVYASSNGYIGGCSNSGPGSACLECETKFTWTSGFDPEDPSIDFWAKGVQYVYMGHSVCTIMGDSFTVNISPPDTTAELPTPEELGPPPCEAQIGDPINVNNGNMYQAEQDVFIPFDRGLSIDFSRSYNSFGVSSGPLGYNWKHSYEYYLDVDSATGNVTLKEPTGREITFVRFEWEGTIEYTPPYGIHYRLDTLNSGNPYILTTEDDTKYYFNSSYMLESIRDRNGNYLTLGYSQGKLTYILHGDDPFLTFNYYLDGNLQNLLVWNEIKAIYDYYPDGNLEKVTYPDGNWVMYTYGERGPQINRITEISNSNGVGRYFGYDQFGRANKTYGNDGVERIDATFETNCSTCPRILDTWAITPVGDSTKYVSSWGPDGTRRFLNQVFNPTCSGCGVEYEYDAGGNISRITYENGIVDSFAYDYRGNMILAIKASNTSLAQEIRYVYHDDFNLPTRLYTQSVANPSSWDTTYYEYDDNGNLDRQITAGWINIFEMYRDTTIYEYNWAGQVTKFDGPRNDVADATIFEYYFNGDLKYIIQANGDTTQFGERDYLGNRPWMKDPNGILTKYFYDTRGKLTKLVIRSGYSDSTVTEYIHNFAGDITEVILPEGNSISYGYDSNNWLRDIVNGANDSLIYGYDDRYNRTSEEIKDSLGILRKFENYEYDNRDRLTRTINPDSSYTEYEYDDVGNVISQMDANGNYTYYEYDELDRLVKTIQMLDIDSIITHFKYDAHNNIIEVIDPDSNVFSYKYSDRDNLIEDSSSITGVTKYSYDAAGNLIRKIDAVDNTAAYDYDELNRLIDISFPDPTQNITYIYDGTQYALGKGRLYQEQSPACTITYRYDNYGRLFQEFKRIDGIDYTTTYRYNKNGNLEKIIYPSGLELQYLYDQADRVNKISWDNNGTWLSLASEVGYAPFGNPTTYTSGSGITTSLVYNYRYLIDSLYTGIEPILNRSYTYDSVGNITLIYDNLDNTNWRQYIYDDLYRLAIETSNPHQQPPLVAFAFNYYDNGNRKATFFASNPSLITQYEYNDNKLVGLSGEEFAVYRYDDLGNITFDSTNGLIRTYEYNHNNRMISVDSGTTARYYYDGEAKRIKKTVQASNTIYLYDQFGSLICEMDSSGSWQTDYIYLNGKPLARMNRQHTAPIRGSDSRRYNLVGGTDDLPESAMPLRDIYYFHVDHLGTPIVMTNEKKHIFWKAEYYPFGEIYDEFTVVSNEVRFPGQYHDEETGLSYNWHRYFDSRTGRYLTPDPSHSIQQQGSGISYLLPSLLRTPQEINMFAYVTNNPINMMDPEGLAASQCEDEKEPWEECLSASPLRSSSDECNKYQDDTYLGVSLRCFCKCAGNSQWSQNVRGCLRCMEGHGVSRFTSHFECYSAADNAGLDRPELRISYCFSICLFRDDY